MHNPDEYIGRTLSIAGDELTFGEVTREFKEVLGRAPPQSPWIVGALAGTFVKELRTM